LASIRAAVLALVLAGPAAAQQRPNCAQAFQFGLQLGWALAQPAPRWPTPRPAPTPPPVPPFVNRLLEDLLRPK